METTQTTNRIHPIMAAAAASVIIVSLTGAAAISGLLPTSKGAPEPMANQQQLAAMAAASPYAMQSSVTPAAGAQGQVAMPQMAMPVSAAPQMVPAMAAPQQVAYAQPQLAPQPTVIVKERVVEKPVVKVVEKTRVVHAAPKQTHYEEPRYQPAPAPAPAQPNYVGIGTGAVIGGLIGNQIGGGNGKKLATVAGVIGGGIIGNQIANANANR
ncbi:glycine zipper 2TM domain-containing protein [Massilia sp. ST3]|uniref:glycine zipper 2TM domain-containing protein n=1 Tax=Massilia sp. ST3 TaxID=2824903 RepID=UPI001B835528|nr:glycine zipper 2TM domain-containing protein [Massilia sp. ST3]MBQ5948976.1 glycine zipper 2TM domain-containing protein [Massilia sp. ST3]